MRHLPVRTRRSTVGMQLAPLLALTVPAGREQSAAERYCSTRVDYRKMTNQPTPSPPDQLSKRGVRRVLLVDDDPQFIQVLAVWLSEEGFAVDLAFDGLQALDAIAEERPDLVIADVSMPRMDGITLANWLKTKAIPAILISANPLPDSAGSDAPFLRKPFDLAEFVMMVHRHVDRAGGGAAA